MSRELPDSGRPGAPYGPRIDTICEHQVILVERYQPGATLADVRASVARLDALRSQHGTVRHVSSTLVPGEEAIFALFVADSIEAVVRLNRAAGLQVDRVVTGVYLTAAAHVEGVP